MDYSRLQCYIKPFAKTHQKVPDWQRGVNLAVLVVWRRGDNLINVMSEEVTNESGLPSWHFARACILFMQKEGTAVLLWF